VSVVREYYKNAQERGDKTFHKPEENIHTPHRREE